MDSLPLLDLVERFQSVLVGALGFLGVMWTLRTNARLSREQHQRQISSRRIALRRILAAEFRNYSHALRQNLETTPFDGMISIGKVRKVFSEDLTTDLGLLELGEIDAVVNALISLDGMAHYVENLSVDQSNTRFLILPEFLDQLQAAALSTADALDLAIEAVEMSGKA